MSEEKYTYFSCQFGVIKPGYGLDNYGLITGIKNQIETMYNMQCLDETTGHTWLSNKPIYIYIFLFCNNKYYHCLWYYLK